MKKKTLNLEIEEVRVAQGLVPIIRPGGDGDGDGDSECTDCHDEAPNNGLAHCDPHGNTVCHPCHSGPDNEAFCFIGTARGGGPCPCPCF